MPCRWHCLYRINVRSAHCDADAIANAQRSLVVVLQLGVLSHAQALERWAHLDGVRRGRRGCVRAHGIPRCR
jgi:hypothetical protein